MSILQTSTEPSSWQQFLEQAVEIDRAGYVPIALSNELWQFHMVFNTILLEQLGVNNYKTFYQQGNNVKQWEKELIESLSIFQTLKSLTDSAQKDRSWSQSAAMIGSGSAAMHVMGDFAKGELIAKGLKAGEDFLCSLAPGSKGSMVYAIDSFVMLNVQEEYLKKGQKLLFDVVLDPVIQAAYSTKKGSTPIRHGVDASQLDSCSQQGYESWQQTSKNNLSFSAIDNPVRASFIQSMLDRAWNQSSTPEQLSRWLIDTVEKSLDDS